MPREPLTAIERELIEHISEVAREVERVNTNDHVRERRQSDPAFAERRREIQRAWHRRRKEQANDRS